MIYSYGGVIICDDGSQILLRRPTNEYDGYVWTFPKGRGEPGEFPEETAVREVLEETGYKADILLEIGSYAGGTGYTTYYIMNNAKKIREPDWETSDLVWAPWDGAEKLIMQTRNLIGRERDISVLSDSHTKVVSDIGGTLCRR